LSVAAPQAGVAAVDCRDDDAVDLAVDPLPVGVQFGGQGGGGIGQMFASGVHGGDHAEHAAGRCRVVPAVEGDSVEVGAGVSLDEVEVAEAVPRGAQRVGKRAGLVGLKVGVGELDEGGDVVPVAGRLDVLVNHDAGGKSAREVPGVNGVHGGHLRPVR